MARDKIQIRPKSKELYDFVKKELKKSNTEITQEKPLKEGIDIFIEDSQVAFNLGRKFKSVFKAKPKVTKSLYGENKQKGKRLYKLTVLLRMPEEE